MEQADTSPPAAPIQVLRKAALLLDLLAEYDELTVARLAELADEPKSTVYRLLSSLESLGFVERRPDTGTVHLGLKLLELGSSVLGRFDARRVALPALTRLHEETEQTVYLCVREGNRAVCIDRIEGRWVRSMTLQIGGSLPLHVGAAPRALLAFESSEFRDRYARESDLSQMTSSTPREPAELLALLDAARNRGYEVAEGDTVIGMAGIAAPVFDFSGDVRASASISGPSEALLGAMNEAYVASVVATAAEISAALGYRAPEVGAEPSRHLARLRAAPPRLAG